MGSRGISKDDADRYGRVIWNFYDKSQKFKAVKAKFESIKSDFDENMDELFDGHNYRSMTVTSHNVADGEPNQLKVSKVERTSIRWDIEKLRKRFPGHVFKRMVKKEYRVVGMPQLVQYLKSCGVDPNIFKQFIVVDETVDPDAIDQLGNLGVISSQQISGCYVVDCAKPYYTVKLVKAKDNEE